MIKTVLGKIENSKLGFTLPHEHIWIDDTLPEKKPVPPLDNFDLSLKELQDYYAKGGRSLVDCNPPGASGNIESLKKLSLASNVHIIASTGFHRDCFYTVSPSNKTEEELVEQFNKEVKEGAGFVKTAVESCGIDEASIAKHTAACKVAIENGIPVMMHVEKNCNLKELIDFYENLGLKPNRLILCHCDRMITNLDEHLEALKRGVYLDYDTIHRYKYHDDQTELNIIKTTYEKYPNQILLSLDSTFQRLGAYGGDTPLSYLNTVFVPLMKENGFSDSDIEKITVKNPAEALSCE